MDNLTQLGDLYRDVILDHFQRPSRKGDLSNAHIKVDGANPLCGDELSYQVRIEDGKMAEIRFSGNGCAISQAAASMLADVLETKTPQEAARVVVALKDLMQGKPQDPSVDLGDLEALVGVRKFPVRVKCAALSWNVIEQALEKVKTITP